MAAPADDPPARRSPGPRRSTAALRASQRQDSERNVTLALGANLVVAAAEFAIGVAIGSAAMLAEAVHSTADSINEVLLKVSLYHGRRPADAVHPRGYAGARFLWAFVAAIMSFVIGGCLSIAIAVYELLHGAPVESFAAAWIVLIVAFVANGA